MPLTYDDISYVLSGFEVYQALLAGRKFEAVSELLRAHAPLQTVLAVLAHFIFGFREWAVYAVNGGLLLALIATVVWIARPLSLLPQIAIPCRPLVPPACGGNRRMA